MSNIPPPDPPISRPIPKEAMKFLKLSPSVKVMTLKKSSTATVCRARASQGVITNNPLAGGSDRSPTATTESERTNDSLRLRPVQKERKLISVFSAKSNKEANKQILENRGIGDEHDSKKDVENIDKKSGPGEKQKHWYGRWMEALLSASNECDEE